MHRKDFVKRFYYHITNEDFGKKKILTPQETSPCRPVEEPNLPRICVAPSVPHCLVSVAISGRNKIYVYRTFNKVQAYYPYGVMDSHVTKEKWILAPTKFILVKKISIPVSGFIEEYTKGIPDNKRGLQRFYLKMFKQIFNQDGSFFRI
jgi:hypothetical protein